MEKVLENIMMGLFWVFFIGLIMGLVKPHLVMRWSKKPTRLKVIGWWFSVTFILLLSFGGIRGHRLSNLTSVELIREFEEKGRHSEMREYLEKILPEDSLYIRAQSLIMEMDVEKERVAGKKKIRNSYSLWSEISYASSGDTITIVCSVKKEIMPSKIPQAYLTGKDGTEIKADDARLSGTLFYGIDSSQLGTNTLNETTGIGGIVTYTFIIPDETFDARKIKFIDKDGKITSCNIK